MWFLEPSGKTYDSCPLPLNYAKTWLITPATLNKMSQSKFHARSMHIYETGRILPPHGLCNKRKIINMCEPPALFGISLRAATSPYSPITA